MTQPNYTAVILDTETTTNRDTPERALEVIELAYRPLGSTQTTTYRYCPERTATWGALAVHHILPDELHGRPPAKQAREDAPRTVQYWIGHNIDFDWKALGSPPGVKRICTLALARSLWPDLDAHNLSAVTYFISGANAETRQRLRSAHSAEADIQFCYEVYLTACGLLKTTDVAEMWAHSEDARIPTKMSFGKFAGQPISAVDKGYAAWYNKQADPDQYVLAAFRRAGLLR